MPITKDTELSAVEQEIFEKARDALQRAYAAKLDATLEVEKWEKFLIEYKRPHD